MEQDGFQGLLSLAKKMRLPSGDDVDLIGRSDTVTSKGEVAFDFFYRNGD